MLEAAAPDEPINCFETDQKLLEESKEPPKNEELSHWSSIIVAELKIAFQILQWYNPLWLVVQARVSF